MHECAREKSLFQIKSALCKDRLSVLGERHAAPSKPCLRHPDLKLTC